MWQKISIIIPVLNQAQNIQSFLLKLQTYRQAGHEIIIVDGQSSDNTVDLARPLVDRLFSIRKGRARQQILGAKMSTGHILLFLHADTILPDNADEIILSALTQGYYWGRFNVQLSGQHKAFRMIEFMMNWRSRLTGIATGDQGIFVAKMLYQDSGGMPDIALMEDIEFCHQLKNFCPPACLKNTVITSSQRWEKKGITHTIFFMWKLRLYYFFGMSAEKLEKLYYPKVQS